MARLCTVFVLAFALGTESASATQQRANPIRKVVTMLQNIQKQVAAEGKKEEEMFEAFMCYCKNGVGSLEKGITDAEAKITSLEAGLKEGMAQKAELDLQLKAEREDRDGAKKAVAEATALRKKEANAYAAMKADSDTNIAAVIKAIAALEKGAGASFLQSHTAQTLRSIAEIRDMTDANRQEMMAFLSGDTSYAPQSGQITGILKEMLSEMEQDLKEATEAETASKASFEEEMAAKHKQIEALTQSIEEKTQRSGELAVGMAEEKNDLEDTKESLAEDQKFLADLQKNCGTKEKEWDAIVKTRNEEMIALSETITLLNDDDSLDLFKKTLPSASSFMQVAVSAASLRARALAVIHAAVAQNGPMHQLDFVALALRGKSKGFGEVVAMIDNMVGILGNEQKEDDKKKEYCDKEFDVSDDKKKNLEQEIADEGTTIESLKEAIAALSDEIKQLDAGIKELDEQVAEATKQRKEENSAFKTSMAENSAAKEIIGIAKNRLNKFYNPALYKPPAKRELSEEDRITVNMGGTLAPTMASGIAGSGVTVLAQADPGPAPEAPGPFKKKTEESNGVIAMMDLLVQDLDKEMTVAEAEEKDAQSDYEAAMKDAADKRAADSKTLEDKHAAKADAKEALAEHEDEKKSSEKELAATMEYIASLHSDCDWLLKYFTQRKEARATEINALTNAKAVLNGADYSLVQASSHRLRRH